MELILKREDFTDKSTIGSLYKDSIKKENFICYTLEDCCRQEFGTPFMASMKVDKETCIPYGRYEIIINFSNRFNTLMPLLLEVPFFSGVRIHKGNDSLSTEGCLCLGRTKTKDWIGESKKAFDPFFKTLTNALKNSKVFITIIK